MRLGLDQIFFRTTPTPVAMMLRVGLGMFILFFLDEGRAGRNDLIGAAFKKQCPLCGPQGFHSRDSELKIKMPVRILLLRLQKNRVNLCQ